MSNNNFKILLKSKAGVELKRWLDDNAPKLKNQRIFYILKANLEKGDVFKIGLSERGGNSAYGRLNDYYHFYGKTNKENPCKGVKLYLVIANTYNPDVQNSDARVRRLETKMKARFKDDVERGAERLKVSIDQLFDYMNKEKLLETREIEKATRQTPRLKEKEQASQDSVKAILGHEKSRRGNYKFEASFLDAFKYDSNQVGKKDEMPNRTLTYDELVQMRHGKRLVDAYIKKKKLKID
jgi:hypothetical protein